MYRIGICDDDYLFCGQIEKYLEEYAQQEEIEIQSEVFFSGEDYLKYMKEETAFDILFLDIELQQINGIIVGQMIRAEKANEVTQIIYISSKENYAMQLFQNRPMDFLVKPIKKEDIEKIMCKYRQLFSEGRMFFEYHFGKSSYWININLIMFFQCSGKKVRIVISGKEEEEFYGKMSDVEKQLKGSGFLTVHKSYIINVNYVSEFRVKEVVMTNGTIVPISQPLRKKVRQRVLQINKLGRY